ncbi:MAG: hypothetical protein ACKV19_16930 [Verrucomicrobiales bacterium]
MIQTFFPFRPYTYISTLPQFIGRSWHTNPVTETWPDAGALCSRDAIKGGYPAVTGLCWLWHYVLAYGYAWEKIDSGFGYLYTNWKRWVGVAAIGSGSPRAFAEGEEFFHDGG